MNNKIVGILVCTLVAVVAVLPASGIMTIGNTKSVENSFSSDDALDREISETDEPIPEPAATKTDYLSIPAAAFTPRNNDMYVKNEAYYLTGEGFFVAPVHLPQGVTVTKLTYYWRNEAPASARIHLSRNYMDGTAEEMANTWINGSVHGNGVSWTDRIDYAEIDNSLYSYFLELGVGPDMRCYGVIIEYTHTNGGNSEGMAYSEENQVSNIVR
jgi:hypothetical protein